MKNFIRFVSKAIGFGFVDKANIMAARYFVNTMPDTLDGSEDSVTVSEEYLKKTVFTISNRILSKFKPVEANGEDSLYLGTAGVAYMYYHLSKLPVFVEENKKFISLAEDYIKPALKFCHSYTKNRSDIPSFILGNCGVYAVAAAVYKSLGDIDRSNHFIKLYHDAAHSCKDMRYLECGSDELFVGRAGYICGALWLAKETNTPLQKNDLYEICKVIINSGREYSQRHRSNSPLMFAYYKVEYLGAAHGLCMILQMLMSVPDYLDSNPVDANDVKNSVDYLLKLQDDEGNFPSATDEIRLKRNELVHWCHGAGGVIYVMARAYVIWHEEKYLNACKKAGKLIWEKGLLKKGPGICHGVAGNGYAFLLLYRLTGENKYLHQAMAFAKFMDTDEFKRNARTPDCPYSLYEGIAGTACFLADISSPSKAAFPFSDVF